MIVVKRGTEDWRELSKEEITGLFRKYFPEINLEDRKVFEVRLRQYNDNLNKVKTIPRGTVIRPSFTVREDGTTYQYAYCHRILNKDTGRGTITELLPKMPQQMGLVLKRLSHRYSEIDKALYILLYPYCENSPFKNGANDYRFYDAKASAKSSSDLIMLDIEIGSAIMKDYDIEALKAYLSTKGSRRVDELSDLEIRTKVVALARKDLRAFQRDFTAGNIGVTADAKRFLESNIVVAKEFAGRNELRYGFGELKGDGIVVVPNSKTEAAALAEFLIKDPTTYNFLKGLYAEKNSLKNAGPAKIHRATTESVKAGHGLPENPLELVAFNPLHQNVFVVDGPGSKKKKPDSKVFKPQNKENWQAEFLEYLQTEEGSFFFQ